MIEEQAAAGASNSIAILSARAIAYNLLGSVYVFQGNNSAVAQQNINIALTMLQVRHPASYTLPMRSPP